MIKGTYMYVCTDLNNGIGKSNKLPWKNKEEMEHFLKETLNRVCLMGSNTYDHLPRSFRESHVCYVMTSNKGKYKDSPEVIEISSLEEFKKIRESSKLEFIEDVCIIGGSKIYELFLNETEYLIKSKLDQAYDCDAFFPETDPTILKYVGTSYRDTFSIEYYRNISSEEIE